MELSFKPPCLATAFSFQVVQSSRNLLPLTVLNQKQVKGLFSPLTPPGPLTVKSNGVQSGCQASMDPLNSFDTKLYSHTFRVAV